ncbi:ribonuclease H-like domain-containing protein [Tanacetum coccineum]
MTPTTPSSSGAQQTTPTTPSPTLTAQEKPSITTSHSPTSTSPFHAAHSPIPATTSAQQPPTRTHPMVTCAQVGTVKPNPHFNFHMSHISPLPKSPSIALCDPNWRAAMYAEYNALVKNSTWMLVLKPPNANVVWSMWLFRHKYHVDGSLSRDGLYVSTTGFCGFSFFTSCLSVTTFLIWVKAGTSCLVSKVAYLLIYVDDIVLTASSMDLLRRIISSLHKEFDMTDLGALNYFLGISVTRDSIGMLLSQNKYALELLKRAHMANCNPTRTPVDTESKLVSDEDLIFNPTLYRSLAGGLQYLTFTRSDISYTVQQVCLHMHDPREPHLAALKRII